VRPRNFIALATLGKTLAHFFTTFGDTNSVSGVCCVSCGKGRDRDGRLCRRCVRTRTLKVALAFIVLGEVSAAAYVFFAPKKADVVVENNALPPPRVTNGGAGWFYYDTTDTLLGDTTHHARLISNRARLDGAKAAVPGASSGMLELATSSHYGQSVVVTFPTVKTSCAAGGCGVKAFFDETQPESFPLQDVVSDKNTTLMLGDYDRFTQRLQVSHDLTVIASLGTKQDVILDFTVQGYRMALRSVRVRYAAMDAHKG
jgi:hypothetical protein